MLVCPELDHPEIRHGFFTRKGGGSSGLYSSLNCGPGSGDIPEIVTENRRRALSCLKVPGASISGLYQVHSSVVHTLDVPGKAGQLPKGDAMVTDRKNIALAILTADCAPVLFADPAHQVIGAAHAGWQGALGGILENTIGEMCRIGAERRDIIAAVGPAISQKNYQVGAEFREKFITRSANYRLFFTPDGERYLFDLKGFISQRLKNSGIADISLLPHDTYADANDFFSYRRATHRGEKDYGRQISLIMLL